MPFKTTDLNKCFTRVRKRIGGPPGYAKQTALAYWNGEQEIKRGMGITSFKMANSDTMHIGFAAWVALDFDMSDHWYKPIVNTNHEGFIVEQYAGPESGLGAPTVGSDRTVMIGEDNCDHYEDQFVNLYEIQIQPWLSKFETAEIVLSHIRSIFSASIILPLIYDPLNKDAIRAQVGQSFVEAPDRQNEQYIDWLEDKDLISTDESLAIKKASLQAIDECVARITDIGTAIINST